MTWLRRQPDDDCHALAFDGGDLRQIQLNESGVLHDEEQDLAEFGGVVLIEVTLQVQRQVAGPLVVHSGGGMGDMDAWAIGGTWPARTGRAAR